MRCTLLVALCALGCTTAPGGATGRYELRTVGDRNLPVVGALGVTYVGGSVTLRADSTFSDVLSYGALGADTLRGRYSLRADSVHFMPNGWTRYAGTLYGNTLRVAWAEGMFVYTH